MQFSSTAGNDAALHHEVINVQRQVDILHARQAELVARWDSRKVWADDGSKSCAHRYARETGLSIADAKHIVKRARMLSRMPVTADAFVSGGLSVSRVDLLIRTNQPAVREVFERDEALLLDLAQSLSFNDAARAMRYWQARANEGAEEDRGKRQHDGRRAHCARTLDSTVDLQASFDPIGGEIVYDEVERLERELFEQDWAEAKAEFGDDVSVDKLKRTPAQRRADALVLMATRSASAAGGSNKPLFTVVLGQESMKRMCELASGTVIAPGQLVPHLFAADLERIIFDGKSRILDVSDKRLFTGALKRAIEVRDRHCQHPSGCDVPANKCQADHVVPYVKSRQTSQDNGQLLCATHNRAKGSGPP
jgi:hypothetical protein